MFSCAATRRGLAAGPPEAILVAKEVAAGARRGGPGARLGRSGPRAKTAPRGLANGPSGGAGARWQGGRRSAGADAAPAGFKVLPSNGAGRVQNLTGERGRARRRLGPAREVATSARAGAPRAGPEVQTYFAAPAARGGRRNAVAGAAPAGFKTLPASGDGRIRNRGPRASPRPGGASVWRAGAPNCGLGAPAHARAGPDRKLTLHDLAHE
jgi:hypothetical protein